VILPELNPSFGPQLAHSTGSIFLRRRHAAPAKFPRKNSKAARIVANFLNIPQIEAKRRFWGSALCRSMKSDRARRHADTGIRAIFNYFF
jgi:hypothetical protein